MKKTLTLFLLLLMSSYVKSQTTEDYISQHVAHAQELMRIHQLPASLILAVAIHESAAGKSKIARYLNNHFGVKGSNNSTEINSSYRDYPSVDSSYNHFVTFLQSRTYFNILFTKYDQYDFKSWAKGIQRGGYAHSRAWSSQVIALINKYQLFQYDERPDDYEEPVIIAPIAKLPSKTKVLSSLYTVKKGDNLSIIAKRNGTTATALKRKNNLKSAALQIGQKIKL